MKQVFSTEFFTRNWSWFLIALVAVFSAAAWIYRWREKSSFENKKDFISIQKSLDRFQGGYFLDSEALEAVEKMVALHPELHARFDFLLAESYLSSGKFDKALKIGQESLKRIEPFVSKNFHHYAATSLLIAENKLGQALENAEILEMELKAHTESENLRAFNLVRILFLAKESGNAERLKTAWEELIKLPSFEKIKPFFSEGKVTLEDFLEIEKITCPC